MNLKDKKCIPHKSYVSPLPESEKIQLIKEIPGWEFNQDKSKILKEYKFKNFKKALCFLTQVAEIAELENHHPDIQLSWGICKIIIWTHVNNNLVENDFILAAKIEDLFFSLQHQGQNSI